MARTYFHCFEEPDDLHIEVGYEARVHPSFTEVEVGEAWNEKTGEFVTLTDEQIERYEAFIAEHHLTWI
jgi:hypothetical protein